MIVTEAKVEELRIAAKASGRPQEIARYSKAKTEFEELKARLFDAEQYTYAVSPVEHYVERLAKEAESGDETAILRYQMMKANRDHIDNHHEEARLLKEGISSMRRLLADGDAVTNAHISAARKIVVQNPTPDNLATLSLLKMRQASQQAGTFVKSKDTAAKEAKITRTDLDAAYEKMKDTNHIDDRVRYATLKRRYEAQEVAK